MGQIAVYGLKDSLNNIKGRLSDIINSCIVEAFQFHENERFHRFFPLDRDNFYFPKERTEKYTIVEISIFEGRSIEAKKNLMILR